MCSPENEENKTLSQNSNQKAVFTTIGASNHSTGEREPNDYYATDPKAAELLLGVEIFSSVVWKPACGEGHLAKVFEQAGYQVRSTDLIYRGYGEKQPLDFLSYDGKPFDGDIITNPPYTKGAQFVEKAIETIADGHKVAMYLKLIFLETKARRAFFEKYPPRTVYVLSNRIKCAKNGDFEHTGSSAIAYAWYVWDKGYTGDPIIRWIN